MLLNIIPKERNMNIYKEIYEILSSNQDVALLSIIEAKGSVPRGAGAKMIVKNDGDRKSVV